MTVPSAWHVHHDQLAEFLTEPIEVRREYIRTTKSAHEQELRLRLLQPVRGVLPSALLQAWQALDQARQALDQARQAFTQAWQAYVQARQAYTQAGQALDQARQAYAQARQAYNQAGLAYGQALKDHADVIDALHAQECPNCPWDGRSILGEVRA